MESNEAEQDSGVKPEGEEEAESSAGEDTEPQVELEEWISQLGILFVLSMQPNCIRGKIKIIFDAVVLTIL